MVSSKMENLKSLFLLSPLESPNNHQEKAVDWTVLSSYNNLKANKTNSSAASKPPNDRTALLGRPSIS